MLQGVETLYSEEVWGLTWIFWKDTWVVKESSQCNSYFGDGFMKVGKILQTELRDGSKICISSWGRWKSSQRVLFYCRVYQLSFCNVENALKDVYWVSMSSFTELFNPLQVVFILSKGICFLQKFKKLTLQRYNFYSQLVHWSVKLVMQIQGKERKLRKFSHWFWFWQYFIFIQERHVENSIAE